MKSLRMAQIILGIQLAPKLLPISRHPITEAQTQVFYIKNIVILSIL